MITQIDAIEKVLGGKSVVLGVGTGVKRLIIHYIMCNTHTIDIHII